VAAVFVQETGGTSGASSPASYAVTLPNPTVSGNLVVIVMASDATVATPAGFSLDKSQVNSNGHYHFSKVAAGENSWTVSPNSSAAGCWYVAEISGLTSTPLDQTASTGASTGATTRSTGTTSATTQAAELAIASWGSSNVGTALTWGAESNSFTERISDVVTSTAGSNVALAVASKVLSSIGSVESTATADSAQAPKSTGMVVTYLVAAAGATVTLDGALSGTGQFTGAATMGRNVAASTTGTGLFTAATAQPATVGTLTSTDAPTSTLTSTDQRTGGPA
jgi:hypothetical protein